MGYRTLLLLTVIAVGMLATNPTSEEYISWLKEQVQNSRGAMSDPLAKGLFALLGGPIIAASTSRANYLLFSVFNTQLDANHRIEVVGVVKNFVPLGSQSR
jgi:hypothetical protein